jgi:hypothetical protein
VESEVWKVMDAKEFVREWTRMCKKYGEVCEGCPLFRETGDPCLLPYCFSEVVVDVVQKWSAEHPLVTNWMKVMEMMGDAYESKSGMLRSSKRGNGLLSIEVDKGWWDAEYEGEETAQKCDYCIYNPMNRERA